MTTWRGRDASESDLGRIVRYAVLGAMFLIVVWLVLAAVLEQA